MSIFLERFVLAICATVFVALVILNAMKLDAIQRVMIGAIVVLVAGFAAYTANSQKRAEKAASPAAPTDSLNASQVGVPYSTIIKVIKVGDYEDFSWGPWKLRVTVSGIKNDVIPTRFSTVSPERVEQAVIYVDTGGGIVYGGDETTHVKTNVFSVPTKEGDWDENRAIYFYSPRDQYIRFFCLVVDHINSPANEVTVKATFLYYER
jgi:hypothetical protein